MELCQHFDNYANMNSDAKSYLGQGAYDHTWPAVLDYLISRGEFLTAYTPYQAELSQGTLQSIFEFQSMIAEMTGMEISNASLYDGSTAALEAILMAARLQRKEQGTIIVSEGVYEDTLSLLKTYLDPLNIKIEIWKSDATGQAQASSAPKVADAFGVLLQSPNKWGVVEDWAQLQSAAASLNVKSIAHVPEMHSLTEFSAPGDFGVDIVSGEGQGYGLPLGYGGPYLGLLCCKKQDVRQIPGRLVGQTEDATGQRAFCVTLSTREQHIRREKATSNICSNQNLMALRAAIYLSLMGPKGLETVSKMNRSRLFTLQSLLSDTLKTDAVTISTAPCFNELSLHFKSEKTCESLLRNLESKNILAGHINKAPVESGFQSSLTIAVTEKSCPNSLKVLADAICGELK